MATGDARMDAVEERLRLVEAQLRRYRRHHEEWRPPMTTVEAQARLRLIEELARRHRRQR